MATEFGCLMDVWNYGMQQFSTWESVRNPQCTNLSKSTEVQLCIGTREKSRIEVQAKCHDFTIEPEFHIESSLCRSAGLADFVQIYVLAIECVETRGGGSAQVHMQQNRAE